MLNEHCPAHSEHSENTSHCYYLRTSHPEFENVYCAPEHLRAHAYDWVAGMSITQTIGQMSSLYSNKLLSGGDRCYKIMHSWNIGMKPSGLNVKTLLIGLYILVCPFLKCDCEDMVEFLKIHF